jgi:hypothetical protein
MGAMRVPGTSWANSQDIPHLELHRGYPQALLVAAANQRQRRALPRAQPATRVVAPGRQIGYMDHAGCHQLVFWLSSIGVFDHTPY